MQRSLLEMSEVFRYAENITFWGSSITPSSLSWGSSWVSFNPINTSWPLIGLERYFSYQLNGNPASEQCAATAAAAKSLQSCPTLCDPRDGSPPGCPVPGILQARTLEWVAISFSNAWKWKVKVKSLSSVWLLVTPWTAAYQAPPPMVFSRQKYWSGVPLPSPPIQYTNTYTWNFKRW